jgi:hypothetical protein
MRPRLSVSVRVVRWVIVYEQPRQLLPERLDRWLHRVGDLRVNRGSANRDVDVTWTVVGLDTCHDVADSDPASEETEETP